MLTPGDTARDLVDKAELYVAQGVPWYWIADADNGVLECRQNVNGRWQVHGTWKRGQVARVPLFDAVELKARSAVHARQKAVNCVLIRGLGLSRYAVAQARIETPVWVTHRTGPTERASRRGARVEQAERV